MKVFKLLTYTFLALALVACGSKGADFVGSPGSETGTTPTIGSLGTVTSATSINADGSETATITTTARDTTGAVMSGLTITFSADSGNLSVTSATTDANGQATTILDTVGNGSARTIVVSASNGGVTGSVSVNVVPTVASLTVSSDKPTIATDGSETAVITAIAKDANNILLSGVTVNFATTSGGLNGASAVTDSNGQAQVTLSTAGDSSVRTITVTASTGGLTATVPVDVIASGTVPISSITLLTNPAQIGSAGTQLANLTAIVKDTSNNAVSGATVQFSSDSGTLSVTQPDTDNTGSAFASLSTAGEKQNRTITVTASTGGITSAIGVDVIGTTLQLSGPTNLSLGDTATYSIILSDSAGTGIGNVTVALASSAGNSLSAASVVTNNAGQASFQLTATQSGPDKLSANGLGLVSEIDLNVSSDEFIFVSPAAQTEVVLNTPQVITVSYSQAGVGVVGETITFTTNRGTFTTTTTPMTGATGQASVTIQSTNAGPAVITATTSAGLSTQRTIEFIATNPAAIEVQASPFTVPVTENSTIVATVRDSANNLVKNATVTFVLDDITGGSLSAGSAITDSQGRAQVSYTASSTTSAKDGVKITASVGNPVVSDVVLLTVAGKEVFISLGTGNSIEEPNTAQYSKEYAIQVTDANGVGVNGVNVNVQLLPALKFGVVNGQYDTGNDEPLITNPPQDIFADGNTVSVNSNGYYKGYHVWNGTNWVPNYTPTDPYLDVTTSNPLGSVNTTNVSSDPNNPVFRDILTLFNDIICENEDANFNGILDAGEDINGNGALDPGNKASISPGTVTTDESGFGFVTITYPQEYAYWLDVTLVAQTSVAGTQFSESSTFRLEGAASDYSNESVAPPGAISPFGSSDTCFDGF